MKPLITVVLCVLTTFSGQAQSDCNPYLPTSKGSKWEITNYSAKGKETGKVVSELIEMETSGNTTTFKVKTTTYDKKGEEIFANTYDAKCVDGKFELNMAMRMDGNSLKAYENMDVQIDATDFEIPGIEEQPGTVLDDGSLTVNMGTEGAVGLSMTVLMTDRKIVGKEQVTTGAGTFDCILLSQKISTKMIVNVQASSKEWYASNIGMVRSESYNKSGKLMGYSELTRLETN